MYLHKSITIPCRFLRDLEIPYIEDNQANCRLATTVRALGFDDWDYAFHIFSVSCRSIRCKAKIEQASIEVITIKPEHLLEPSLRDDWWVEVAWLCWSDILRRVRPEACVLALLGLLSHDDYLINNIPSQHQQSDLFAYRQWAPISDITTIWIRISHFISR